VTLQIHNDRLVQLLMKADPTLGLDAARIQLERAALVISAGSAVKTRWGQAALLTIAVCATRSFRGGVYLRGDFDAKVRVGNWMPIPLRRMLIAAGCRSEDVPDHAISLFVGADDGKEPAKVHCWADGWMAVVSPNGAKDSIHEGNELSGALAGAMAVTECFRMGALGDLIAGKRTQRLSPLTPSVADPQGLELSLLPSSMWILGLGNLGQALLWVLGLLPYADPCAVQLILQDLDLSGPENVDIQILTEPQWMKIKKTRSAAAWSEERGFRTAISELAFSPTTVRSDDQPGLAFVGVDNIETRRFAAHPGAGFDLVLDAGLGATASEVFDLRVHGFPGSRTLDEAWPMPDDQPSDREKALAAHLATLVSQGRLTRCGAFSIAGQSVGIPGTAVAAATIQIAQACRAIMTGRFCDLVDVSLLNTSRAETHETKFERARVLLFEEARRPEAAD
jgi:hypothetical protein